MKPFFTLILTISSFTVSAQKDTIFYGRCNNCGDATPQNYTLRSYRTFEVTSDYGMRAVQGGSKFHNDPG